MTTLVNVVLTVEYTSTVFNSSTAQVHLSTCYLFSPLVDSKHRRVGLVCLVHNSA